jgi:hypothetical protein
MRHTNAEVERWLANDRIAQDRHAADESRLAHAARAATPGSSFRQRAGEAVIAFGTRLAGNRESVREQPRLVTRAS